MLHAGRWPNIYRLYAINIDHVVAGLMRLVHIAIAQLGMLVGMTSAFCLFDHDELILGRLPWGVIFDDFGRWLVIAKVLIKRLR